MVTVTPRAAREKAAAAPQSLEQVQSRPADQTDAPPGQRDPAAELEQFIASIPNFEVKEAGAGKINGVEVQQLKISYGDPAKHVVIRVLDVADEWDLAELAGESGKSDQWLMMAKTAAAVVMIDGVHWMPGRGGYTRDHLRSVLRALGTMGVNAIAAAQAGLRPSAAAPDVLATAKN